MYSGINIHTEERTNKFLELISTTKFSNEALVFI